MLWQIPLGSAALCSRHVPGSPCSILALLKVSLLFQLFAIETTRSRCLQLLLPVPGGCQGLGSYLLNCSLEVQGSSSTRGRVGTAKEVCARQIWHPGSYPVPPAPEVSIFDVPPA